jgi:hypothetical protein
MSSGVSLEWPTPDTRLWILQEIDSAGNNPATADWITHQLHFHHGWVYLSLIARALTVPEVRGLITRLVNQGYVRRAGTPKMQWYVLTSMGRGYISEEAPLRRAQRLE